MFQLPALWGDAPFCGGDEDLCSQTVLTGTLLVFLFLSKKLLIDSSISEHYWVRVQITQVSQGGFR